MSSAQRRLRVAVAGAGWVTLHHLTAWYAMPNVEVVGIADLDATAAQERAAQFNIARVYGDVGKMLHELKPDALDIATPVETHAELCELAATSGSAILCQKPLAETWSHARSIVENVGTRVPFMVHENWRFRPHFRSSKQFIEDGLIGDTSMVRLSIRSSGLLPDASGQLPSLTRQPFLADLPRFLVFELIIHHLDVLRWLFGDLDVRSAQLTRASGATKGEDTAAIHLTNSAGVPIALDATFACPGAPSYVADHMEIIGSLGTITLNDTTLRLRGKRDDFSEVSFDEMYAAAYAGAISEFANALVAGRQFEASPAHHLRALKLVEDIYDVAQR